MVSGEHEVGVELRRHADVSPLPDRDGARDEPDAVEGLRHHFEPFPAEVDVTEPRDVVQGEGGECGANRVHREWLLDLMAFGDAFEGEVGLPG